MTAVEVRLVPLVARGRAIGVAGCRAPVASGTGDGGWHFVSLPADVSADITDIAAGARRGFGSVRVAVKVGATSWHTSIFPDNKTGTYLLPVNKAVRIAEQLKGGDEVRAELQLSDV